MGSKEGDQTNHVDGQIALWVHDSGTKNLSKASTALHCHIVAVSVDLGFATEPVSKF